MFHNHVQFTFSKPIPQVRPVSIDVMCPSFQDTPQVDRDIIVSQVRLIRSESEAVFHADPVDDGFDDDYGRGFDLNAGDVDDPFERPPRPRADFSAALAFSGLHHVIDNSTGGFADALPSYKDNLAKARDVSKLLRRRDTVPKLMARCFSSTVGRQLQPVLKSFRGWVHERRWGTIAFSMPELGRVEGALRWGWSKDHYLRGDDADVNLNAVGEESNFVQVQGNTCRVYLVKVFKR